MADNEHRVLKSNTFEDQRQKVNEISFDVGDDALLDNTRLSDKVFTYTASANQTHYTGNDNNSDSLVIQKLPDATIDNTAGYIILAHGTTIPASYVNGANIVQGSSYSATIESVVTLDNKSRILVKNSTGTFSTSTNLAVGSDTIAHANILRIVSEAFPKGNVRVTKNGTELVQGLTEAGFHIPNHRGTIALTSSPSVNDITEGVTIYQTSDASNKSTQADVESQASWWATVYHANTSSIKTKNNNGTFSTSRNIRVLGYNSSSIASANVGPLSLLDATVSHSVELNNEAASGNTVNVITTDLVSAINELQDDIGTVENLATADKADLVSAINEIEGVFDASAKKVNTASNVDFTLDIGGDLTLDADGGDVIFKDNGTEHGRLRQVLGGLTLTSGSSGTAAIVLDTSGNAIFGGNISASSGQITAGGTSSFVNLDISGNVDIDGSLETDALSINGTTVSSTATELNILDGATLSTSELNLLDGVTASTAELNLLDGVTATTGELNILDGVTATAADINLIDGITNGTVTASKAVIVDANKDIAGFRNITLSGELDAATLDISGNVDIDGTLDVAGLSTLVNVSQSGNYTLNGTSKTFKIQNGSGVDKFTVLSASGNTTIEGSLTLGDNLTTAQTPFSSANHDIIAALNLLGTAVGDVNFTAGTDDIIGNLSSGGLTQAIKLIQTEIGDDEAYRSPTITFGADTVSGVLVNLNNELDALNALTLTAGNGLSGGGNLTANRSFAVNVDDSSIEINSDSLRVKAGGITNDMLAGSINEDKLAGAIPNDKLENSTITISAESGTNHAIALGETLTVSAGTGINTNIANNTLTVSAELATASNAGVATFDSTDFTVSGGGVSLNDERIEDIIGAMVTGGTEDGISVTYTDDSGDGADTGKLNFNIDYNDVVKTSTNQTIAGTKTFTGTIDLTGGTLLLGGGAGTDESFNTAFLTLASTASVEGIKIDRSEITSATVSTSIDPTIQWNEAKVGTGASNTSHRAWEVKGFSNASTPVATTADLVTFYNAKDLIGSSSDGLTHTWDDDETTGQHFELGISDGGIAITKLANIPQNRVLGRTASGAGPVSAVQVTNAMLAGSIAASKLAGAIPNNKLENSEVTFGNTTVALGSSSTSITGLTDIDLTSGNKTIFDGVGANTLTIGASDTTVATAGNLTVGGNLVVQGSTTTVNSTVMTVDDPIITLGGDTAPSSNDQKDKGIEFRWHDGTDPKVGFFGYNENDGQFTFIKDATNNSEVFSGAVGTIAANLVGTVTGNASSATTATTATRLSSTRTFSLAGDITGSVTSNLNTGLTIDAIEIDANTINFTELNAGTASTGQVLAKKATGSGIHFIDLPTGDTYNISVVDSSGVKLRLSGTSGSTDDVQFTGTGGVTVSRTNADTININAPAAYTLPVATSTVLGGIKIFSNTDQAVTANAVTATANRTYGSQLNSNDQLVVNVPWVNTEYTAGTGLTLSGTVFNANVDGTNSVSPNTSTNTAGRTYKVQVDSSDNLVVNVPWVDTNTQNPVANNGLLDINAGNLIDLSITGGDFTADKATETDITINVDLSELNDMTQNWNSSQDEFVVLDNGSQKRKLSSEIGLLAFNNDANYSTTTGTVTSVSVGTGLDVSNATTTPSISLDLSELTDMTEDVDGSQDELILLDNNAERKKQINEIKLGQFNNDQNFTNNTGTIERVQITAGNGLTHTGDLNTTSGSHIQEIKVGAGELITLGPDAVSVNLSLLNGHHSTLTSNDLIVILDSTETGLAQQHKEAIGDIPLSIFSKGNFLETDDLTTTARTENETFTGAEVPNVINIASNNLGQLTTLNVTKRTLTLAQLGYTGDTNAQVNQHAFSNIRSSNNNSGHFTHAADNVTDTFDIDAGTNLTIVNGTDKITINNDISHVFNKVRISQQDGTTIATNNASGITDTIDLRAKSGITLTDEGSGVFGISSETYAAGAGLDLSGSKVFSIESDLRGDVTQFGPDTNDYMVIDSNSVDFFLDGERDMSLENDGELHVRGDVIAFSTTITSDEKLKENVQVINGALELVSQLDGVTFNWKENGKKSAGVIAQDVEKVLPSAVKEVDNMDKTDTHKVVDYNQLSALFIEAIKELKEENKVLKAEIESLKDINKGIE